MEGAKDGDVRLTTLLKNHWIGSTVRMNRGFYFLQKQAWEAELLRYSSWKRIASSTSIIFIRPLWFSVPIGNAVSHPKCTFTRPILIQTWTKERTTGRHDCNVSVGLDAMADHQPSQLTKAIRLRSMAFILSFVLNFPKELEWSLTERSGNVHD